MMKTSYNSLSTIIWLLTFSLLIPLSVKAQGSDALLFTWGIDGNREIYVMNPDSSNQLRLTNNTAEDNEPAWSPDRQQIAFSSNRTGNRFAIFVMNADGSNVRQVTDENRGSFSGSPTWAPDGQSLAYVSNESGISQVHVISLDGSDPRRITNGPGESIDPAWSPDGQWIAYASDATGNFEIYIARVNGGEIQQLTNAGNISNESPAWSVDGTHIAYAGNSGNGGDIYVMNADGSDSRPLAGDEESFAASPTWSQDGQEIAYVLKPRDQTLKPAIFIADQNGMAARQLNNEASEVKDPAWGAPHHVPMPEFAGSAAAPAAPAVCRQNTPDYRTYSEGIITTARLNMRQGPSPDYYAIARLSQNDRVRVIGRSDQTSWILIDSGTVGWINSEYIRVEGGLSALPVYSANDPLPCPQLPLNHILYDCPAARGPSFSIGNRFRVPPGDGPTNIYAQAGSEPIIGQVSENQGGLILGGPICTQARLGFLTWWLVQADNGTTGYMSEGYDSSPIAFIAPA